MFCWFSFFTLYNFNKANVKSATYCVALIFYNKQFQNLIKLRISKLQTTFLEQFRLKEKSKSLIQYFKYTDTTHFKIQLKIHMKLLYQPGS